MRSPLPINLDALLRRRSIEGERVEYKAGWNPESALHTICAFANDFHNLGGGYLVIGVEEANGRPVLPPKGIDPGRVDAMQKELLRLGHQAIQPAFHPLSARRSNGRSERETPQVTRQVTPHVHPMLTPHVERLRAVIKGGAPSQPQSRPCLLSTAKKKPFTLDPWQI